MNDAFRVTFVTCFYQCFPDMDVHAYLRRCLRTISIPVPLVIFCEEPHREFFQLIRKAFDLEHQTRIVCIPIEQLFFYQFKDQVDQNRSKYWPTRDSRVNTLSHLLTLSKFQFLKDTVIANPFNTSHFGWIDVNLLNKLCNDSTNYVRDDVFDRIVEICRNPKPRFCIEAINCWKPEDYANLRDFYSSYRWIVAGLFYTFEAENGRFLLEKLIEKSVEITTLGYGHAEEHIFAFVIDEFEEYFNLYLGDYQDAISNYYKLTTNAGYVQRIVNIHRSRSHDRRIDRILQNWEM